VPTEVEKRIEEYRRENPQIFPWEMRDRLIKEGLCDRASAPAVSVIGRIVKSAGSVSSGSAAIDNASIKAGKHTIDGILGGGPVLDGSGTKTKESGDCEYLNCSKKFFYSLLSISAATSSSSSSSSSSCWTFKPLIALCC